MTQSSGTYKRALVLRFGGLGDILLSTPMVRAIADANPGIEIDYVVGIGSSAIVSSLPYIRKVFEYDKSSGAIASLRDVMRTVGQSRYDLFVNLQPSVKSVLIGLATGAPKQVMFVKDRRRQKSTGRVRHAIDDFTKHLVALGIAPPTDRTMDYVVSESAAASVGLRLREAGLLATDRLLVINPNASRPVNRWPVDRMAAVCRHFASLPGVRVALVGSKAEANRAEELISNSGGGLHVIDTTGQLSMDELGALLNRGDAFLTCDTGPMHIAAALDRPLVCLSGAADPDRSGPISLRSTVLIDRSLPCTPCQRKTCIFGDDIKCMSAINVASVIKALEAKLAESDISMRR